MCTRIALVLACTAAVASASPIVFLNVPLTWRPAYTAKVVVVGVPSNSTVTLYVPMSLRDAHVHAYPAPLGIEPRQRYVFDAVDGELASVGVFTGTLPRSSTVSFAVNGTEAFGPVRFPVTVCARPRPPGTRCWTNEATWATPTAYEWLLSCRLVAIGSLLFWSLAVCFVCFCLCRLHRDPDATSYGRVVATKAQRVGQRNKRRRRRRRRLRSDTASKYAIGTESESSSDDETELLAKTSSAADEEEALAAL